MKWICVLWTDFSLARMTRFFDQGDPTDRWNAARESHDTPRFITGRYSRFACARTQDNSTAHALLWSRQIGRPPGPIPARLRAAQWPSSSSRSSRFSFRSARRNTATIRISEEIRWLEKIFFYFAEIWIMSIAYRKIFLLYKDFKKLKL